MRPIEKVLERLKEVRKIGKGWQFRCEAHSDRTSSGSAAEGEDGRVLLKCHAGCKTEDVVAAADLTMGDLFYKKSTSNRQPRVPSPKHPTAEPIASDVIERMHQQLSSQQRVGLQTERMLTDEVIDNYRLGCTELRDEVRLAIPIADGQGVYRDVRLWLHPRARKAGSAKVLHWAKGYGAPRLYPIDQIEYDELVFCEGELDALALISAGVHAVTLTAGADTAPTAEDAQKFRGKIVTLLMDNDEAGRRGAERRAAVVVQHAQAVKIAHWPEERSEKWDVTDELKEHSDEHK